MERFKEVYYIDQNIDERSPARLVRLTALAIKLDSLLREQPGLRVRRPIEWPLSRLRQFL